MSMASAFAVCLDPGSEVLVPDPGWPNYGLSATILGATLVPYPCPASNGWLPDLDALAAAVTTKTRMIVLCNPSNPTGALIPASHLRKILELAAAKGLFVLADEIYHDIAYTDDPPASTLTVAEELGITDHVLLIGGASKSFAMTGFRLGYMAGPRAAIKASATIQGQITSCASSVSQRAGLAALQGTPDAWVDDAVAAMYTEAHHRLASLGHGLIPCNVRREGARSLAMLEGKERDPLQC
jgi:aspartate aminotransferase